MSLLNLSETQKEKYDKWAKSHECVFRTADGLRYVGAVGGADTFHLTGSGIGWFVEVSCACGARCDLTEDF